MLPLRLFPSRCKYVKNEPACWHQRQEAALFDYNTVYYCYADGCAPQREPHLPPQMHRPQTRHAVELMYLESQL